MTRTIAVAVLVILVHTSISWAQPPIIFDPQVINADGISAVLRDAIAQVPADEPITGPLVVVRRVDAVERMPPASRLALQQELARLGREAVFFTSEETNPTIYVLADAIALEQGNLVKLAAALVGAQRRANGHSPRAAAAAELRVYRALDGDDADYVELATRPTR
jgi:hypothetical protein